MVLLLARNLKLLVPKRKLSACYIGPFCMCDIIGKQVYRLALSTLYYIYDIFHVLLLELYRQRAGKELAEPIAIIDEACE